MIAVDDALAPVAAISGLTVHYAADPRPVVGGVDLALAPGDVLGLVGESGSGKSTIALHLLGYRPPESRLRAGRVVVAGRDMLAIPERDLRAIRGRRIGYVPQNPAAALNPARRIGSLMIEMLREHGLSTNEEADLQRAAQGLSRVGLKDAQAYLRRFPHQLSGGQQQRVAIALALACDPEVVVLDEPTTGLDVSTQSEILALLRELRRGRSLAMLYVTHDLSALEEIATRIMVLYAGQVVETGPIDAVLRAPAHPYTRALLGSVPRISGPRRVPLPLKGLLRREDLPAGCAFAPRCPSVAPGCVETPQVTKEVAPSHRVACQRAPLRAHGPVADDDVPVAPVASATKESPPVLAIERLSVAYSKASVLGIARHTQTQVVEGVDLSLQRGRMVSLVGESGSGKSTIAKAIAGLLTPLDGRIQLEGESLLPRVGDRTPEQRRRISLVFQNPDASLNPRHRVGRILTGALASFERLPLRVAQERSIAALADVRLPASYLDRFPDQLSGGERQRVAIARALIVDPEVLICDEILSALDVSVQASILDLLQRLRREKSLTVLFISHDLAVVRSVTDEICVLYAGRVIASGEVETVLQIPRHPYVNHLLDSLPGRIRTSSPALTTRHSMIARPACPFAPRCPVRIEGTCENEQPPERSIAGSAHFMCHQTPARLAEAQSGFRPDTLA